MERITRANCVGPARYGHEFRYRLAAGFVRPGDWVLDAACGTGYGYWLLHECHGGGFGEYIGVDKSFPDGLEMKNLQTGDLESWVPPWDFDVFLGFETIEHLANYDHYVRLAQDARKWILVSTPVVATLHLNPWHVHDFEPGQLREIFENEEWEHYQTVQQPSELSEIVVLRRRT